MAKRSNSERRPAASRDDASGEETTSPTGEGPYDPVAAVDAPVTRELPAIELATAEDEGASGVDDVDVNAVDEFDALDEGATREAEAIQAPGVSLASADPDATVIRATLPPSDPLPDTLEDIEDEAQQPAPAQETSAPRPRFNTLAGAFSRPRSTPPTTDPISQPTQVVGPAGDDEFGIADEVDPEYEWSVADQPTIHLSPEELRALRPASFLDTGEQSSWPPRPQASMPDARAQAPTQPRSAPPPAGPDVRDPRNWRAGLPPRPQPPFPLGATPRPLTHSERLAAPDGRAAPPPDGPPADFRMERFQELRRHRVAHEQGEAATDDVTPVADAVRQWWSDLRPGVGSALRYQREARASGSHPLPAYAPPPPTSRLGDAFGRLAASAREMTGRVQQTAAPTFKRIHDQVEHAAQGIIQRFEGDAARQQAPLLGPGRVAVFFRRGVTVGQAQRLLAASSARPMRLIPRKHGILTQVAPGRESEIGERLRQHPYVEDVVYIEYDERGEPRNDRD